jgi:outer membrane lipoprotein-sorting protein
MSVPARRSAIRAIVIVVVGALAILPGTSSGAPPDDFDQLYAQGQKINGTMRTLTARFTEATASTLLTKPITARGRLWVERPSRVILRYTDPDARVVLIDGNRMIVAWPSRNINQTLDIATAQGRVQKYFVNGTAADLRRQFDIDMHGDGEARPNAYYVSMAPKRKQMRETLTRLELWVGRASMLLEGMKMTFANGDVKTMTFEDVVPNASIDARTFSLTP